MVATVTLDTLENEISALVVDLPAAVLPYVIPSINQAILDIQFKYNFRAMRSTWSPITTTGQFVVDTLPSNWKSPRKRPWLVDSVSSAGTGNGAGAMSPLEWLGDDEEEIYKLYTPTNPDDKGAPKHLFIRELEDQDATKRLEAYPIADANSGWTDGKYRLIIPYYKYLDDLVAASDHNWITDHAREYIVHQAAGHLFLKDWDSANAATHFQAAVTFERMPKRADAAFAGPSPSVLKTRSDVNGPAGGVGWRW